MALAKSILPALLFLTISFLFAFQNTPQLMAPLQEYDDYALRWKQVDSLETEGLSKSALDAVNKIYAQAISADNAPQIVKALIYTLKYKQILEEGGNEKALLAFEMAIQNSRFPVKNILQSAAAELYWNYYQQNRWNFAGRTQTSGANEEDIATWDLQKIIDRSATLYKASIDDEDSLRQLSIMSFAALLEKGNMPVKLRPSLYDFLAHRALDFFMNEETYVTQPAYKFNITGTEVFESAKNFAVLNIETKDTVSGKYQALKILQHLLAYHATDHDPAALVDADLKRFAFLRSNSINDLKDSLYLDGLLQLRQRYLQDAASAAVTFAIADFYEQNSNQFQPPLMNDHQFDKKTALSYCEEVLENFPDVDVAKNCKALKESILSKNLSLTVEAVNVSGQPFRGLVEYRNVKTIYFRIIKDTPSLMTLPGNLNIDKEFATYLQQPVLETWSQTLPDPGDFQTHTAEVKLPAMPLGHYIIIGSSTENFSLQDGGLIKAVTTISNIAYVSKRYNDHYSFFVLQRESGKPMNKVAVSMMAQQYDSKSRTYKAYEAGRYETDQNGYFEIANDKGNNNFKLEFAYGTDTLLATDYFYLYREQHTTEKTLRTAFFTDRAIYRPGQTIYFKGIVMENEGERHSLKTHFKSTIEFYDVNNRLIQSLDLVTNEYGSFQGSFTAPSNGLNGEMYLRNGSGTAAVSVEEYKRPHFEVVFDTLKGSWRLNDTVKITATAKSYSAANIDGATVTWRVLRQSRSPVWYDGFKQRGYPQYAEEMEISNGIATTDANGSFSIAFAAIPDQKISIKEKPQFDYRLMADVMDITGETHSAETTVTVGTVSLKAAIEIPETLSTDSLQKIKISTTNLNGIFEPAQGYIGVTELQQPDRIFRDRLWKQPDQFAMTAEAYRQLFPRDVYNNENDFTTWPKKRELKPIFFNTASSVTFDLPASLQPGKYEVALTAKDRYGESMVVKKYVTVYAPKSKQLPLQQTLWSAPIAGKATAGDLLSLPFGTAEKELHMIYEVESQQYSERRILDWKQGIEKITLPITDAFIGGVTINLSGIRNGRVYTFSQTIIVPYNDKELHLEFETFRNKLLPGSHELWKLKISGPKGEAVAAEMVASLYDASLDVFRPHNWYFNVESDYRPYSFWSAGNCFGLENTTLFAPAWSNYSRYVTPAYDHLNWFGFVFGSRYYLMNRSQAFDDKVMLSADEASYAPAQAELSKKEKDNQSNSSATVPSQQATAAFSARKNLQETAFFFPQMQTDSSGNIIIGFEMPEALTRWKLLGFAHTDDLKYGFITKETVTQKELMITPNAPRFFREGDELYFAAKVNNLSDHPIEGTATLEIFDALTMKPVDEAFGNTNRAVKFAAGTNQSNAVFWHITIPKGTEAVTYRVIAKAGNQTDGEENVLPVLSNRVLVTETFPLNIRGNQVKNFSFNKLLQSGASTSLSNYRLTLEFTSNPAWYAVQALPYLMEFPYQCSEQTFNRFYANALAGHIAHFSPGMKAVFDQWRNGEGDALLSNLEKNQELKSLLLEETPWLLQAQDETVRKKRIALLFDLNRMHSEQDAAIMRLQQQQMPNGGWPWFAGGPDDRYITQYILSGIGHLHHLKALNDDDRLSAMISLAVQYLDNRMREDYEDLIRHHAKLNDNNLGNLAVQYLYARSFFLSMPLADENKKAFEYWQSQAQQYWTRQGIYAQGMIALALKRMHEAKTAAAIIRSLKENSINNELQGMYWKSNAGGYYWYQAPIETQALLIEAFDEATADTASVDAMKLWLLKQKQTNDWKTTKATAEAIYALLLRGGNWLENEPEITVTLGNTLVELSKEPAQAGTGYFKTGWQGSAIEPQMGNIKVTSSNAASGVSWGALYWQYFEQMDQITASGQLTETPLSLQKQLFVQHNSATGPVMEPVTAASLLQPGDLVKVRIILKVDREMEYVHMKDLRAACFEPVNVLSGYRWQDGLGYYEETKDASTNFFFDHVSKGTYVFEYPLRVQLKGNYSNGITSIQCMYAPEFANHSAGIQVTVK